MILLTGAGEGGTPSLALGAEDYLPKSELGKNLNEVLQRHVGTGNSSKRQVLVAEDDRLIREIIGRQLSRDGWDVVLASNGRSAIEAMQAQVPTLVLLDLMMPGMDGFGVLREMRADDRLKHVPVVVLTSLDLTGSVRQLLRNQTERILQKGRYSKEELLAELRSTLVEFGSKSAPTP